MASTPQGIQKKRKHGLDESPDKSHYVLSKSLEVCGVNVIKSVQIRNRLYSVTCAACGHY